MTKKSIGKLNLILFIFIFTVAVLLSGNRSQAVELFMPEEDYLAAREELRNVVAEHDIAGCVYLALEVEVMDAPGWEAEAVASLGSGQTVFIKDADYDEECEVWLKIEFFDGEDYKEGWIYRENVATEDEQFLNWEMERSFISMSRMYSMISAFALAPGQEEIPEDIKLFPEAYQGKLMELHRAHPNWKFVVYNANVNFYDEVNTQNNGSRSLIGSSSPAYMRTGTLSQPGFYVATKEAIAYYLDPRNSLDEAHIFQFEQLTYNESYQSLEATQAILNNSFMKGKLSDDQSKTYAQVIYEAGRTQQLSPYHLASRLKQEQGLRADAVDGSGVIDRSKLSPLISGMYPGYEGYYNYFNVQASGATKEQIYANGLAYAKNAEQNWNSVERSIMGGAAFIGTGYIKRGQDTSYLQKFNLAGERYHQYMQNIQAPYSESVSMKSAYVNAGAMDQVFVFKIPVFKNMPAQPAECSVNYKITITPPAGYTDNTLWVDGVAYQGTSDGLGNLWVKMPNGNSKVVTMYIYKGDGTPSGMAVWTLGFNNGAWYISTRQSSFDNLFQYVGFSIRLSDPSGIRLKTSINTGVRNALTTSGIAGYKLKSYGTLIMRNSDAVRTSLLTSNAKAANGVAYSSGQFDNLFGTQDGRYVYTVVLINQPSNTYATELAYRPYMVLTNGSSDITIYGYVAKKSIYDVAKAFYSYYQDGSNEKAMLQKIITAVEGAH